MSKKDEALKLALENAQPSFMTPGWTLVRNEDITAIREALAEQPAQQQDLPDFIAGALGVSRGTAYDLMREALAEQPAQQQEPVAWVVEDQHGERLEWAGDIHSVPGLPTFPLYTSTPAQRKPLTDEQIGMAFRKAFPVGGVVFTNGATAFARAIEAAHGIKGDA